MGRGGLGSLQARSGEERLVGVAEAAAVLEVEGLAPDQQDEEDHASRPHVHGGRVRAVRHDLRCHKARRAQGACPSHRHTRNLDNIFFSTLH